MSKAMVTVSTGSQNELIALKQGRKEIVSQDKLSSWLEDARSGKSLLSPVIPSTVNGVRLEFNAKGMDTVSRVGSSIAVGMMGTISGFFITLCTHGMLTSTVFPSFNAFDAVILATSAGLSGFGTYFMTSNKNEKSLWNSLVKIQSEGLRSWLQVRYQVEVSDEVLTATAVDMLQSKETISLIDSNGHNWVLQLDREKQSYQLEPAPIDAKTDVQISSLQQAPVKIVVGASSLPEPAQKVIDSIDVRLSQLYKFALSTEQSHVVARTVDDAREAVAAFERLDALGAGESGLERLIIILSLLDGELEKIVQTRIAEESAGFSSRQKSVEARLSKVEA